MPKTYRVLISPDAAEDLRRIHAHVEQSSPQNAANVVRKILNAIDGLAIFPYRYQERSTGRGTSARSIPMPPYRVLYEVEEPREAVRVLRIEHGSRNTWQ